MPYLNAPTHRHRAQSASTIAERDGGLRDEKRYPPSHDEIARLAYSYWQARRGEEGSACEDWLRAEQELTRRRQR